MSKKLIALILCVAVLLGLFLLYEPKEKECIYSKPLKQTSYIENQMHLYDDNIVLDYGNSNNGYITISSQVSTSNQYKVEISTPEDKVIFPVISGMQNYPLTLGSNTYTISIFKRVAGVEHEKLGSVTFECSFIEQLPFTTSNFMINYDNNNSVKVLSDSICNNICDTDKKIHAIYKWVSRKVKYDQDKADANLTNYIPNLSKTIETKKGICIDYATLTTALLRIQNIPSRVIVGTYEGEPHAWVEAWNGDSWKSIDPTLEIKDTTINSNYQKIKCY